LQTLIGRKEAIETGKFWGPPAVNPLVLPNAVFERRMDITIGDITVELHNMNIHTPDSVVAYIPRDKIVLPGDTIEDSVVFISNPSNVVEQIDNLAEFGRWDITRLYPSHGNIELRNAGFVFAGAPAGSGRSVAYEQSAVQGRGRLRPDLPVDLSGNSKTELILHK
jgi:glyoxylase-like metal-dependent hydrolase (beta-lactamase superfamily II)